MSSMTTVTRICTYNMGGTISDYMNLIAGTAEIDPSTPKGRRTDIRNELEGSKKTLEEGYRKAEDAAAGSLADASFDVFCLQEMGTRDRPLVRSLLAKNFTLIHVEERIGLNPGEKDSQVFTAIALSDRYTDVQNLSENIRYSYQERARKHRTKKKGDKGSEGPEQEEFVLKKYEDIKDVAIAVAYDTQLKQRVAFVSIHVPGMDFDNPTRPNTQEPGNALCEEIAKRIARIPKCSLKFIGADMNGTPEIAPERFRLLTSSGMALHRTESPTNVDPRADSIHTLKRELDYVFSTETPTSSWKIIRWIKALFAKTIESSSKISVSGDVRFDPATNGSDHAPVIARITVTIKPSLCSRFCAAIASVFSRCARPARTATT